MEALGCCGCPPVSPSTSVSFPQVWLPSRDHHSGARPVMGSSSRVLGLNSPHLPSCYLWGPTGPAWAAGQVEGLQWICSLVVDAISRHSGGTSSPEFGSNNEMSRSICLSIHLRCVLPQGLSWGDFGSTEWGVAKRRGAGPWPMSSLTPWHLAAVSQPL